MRPKPYEPGSRNSRVTVSVIIESKSTNDDEDDDIDRNRGRHGGIASVILLFMFSFCPSIKKMNVYISSSARFLFCDRKERMNESAFSYY